MTYYVLSDWADDGRVLSGNEVNTELEAKAIVSRLTGVAILDKDISLVKQRLDADDTSCDENVHFSNLFDKPLNSSEYKSDVFYTDKVVCPETHTKHCSSFEYWVADSVAKTCTMNHTLLDDHTSVREMELIRSHRNRLLAETDWTGTPDVTMSDNMKTYRQMLRDIPATNTIYKDVDWGTKP